MFWLLYAGDAASPVKVYMPHMSVDSNEPAPLASSCGARVCTPSMPAVMCTAPSGRVLPPGRSSLVQADSAKTARLRAVNKYLVAFIS
ncbi:hypothetical protein NXX58_21025 [Phocaeicola vulgatus]|uniref:hypothetical protein n=1 Tax=Phocaeicola vulgatus TaxID=821 RepID=UPI002166B5DB|nr:hypothetical protein [Phocaeicola vulgatus]MCS2906789.1 hypothetical protein [Phocaeicola vulgatus]